MTFYFVCNAETGDMIDAFLSLDEAKKTVDKYEEEDKATGFYFPNWYEIRAWKYNTTDAELIDF